MKRLALYAFKVNSMDSPFYFVKAKTDEEAIEKMKKKMIDDYCWDGKPQYIVYWFKDAIEHYVSILIRDGLTSEKSTNSLDGVLLNATERSKETLCEGASLDDLEKDFD